MERGHSVETVLKRTYFLTIAFPFCISSVSFFLSTVLSLRPIYPSRYFRVPSTFHLGNPDKTGCILAARFESTRKWIRFHRSIRCAWKIQCRRGRENDLSEGRHGRALIGFSARAFNDRRIPWNRELKGARRRKKAKYLNGFNLEWGQLSADLVPSDEG